MTLCRGTLTNRAVPTYSALNFLVRFKLSHKLRLATSPLAIPIQHTRCAIETIRRAATGKVDTMACEVCQQIKVIRSCLSPGATVIDVGAHVGMMSSVISKASPGGRLFILEPVPSKAKALVQRFPDATVFHSAASDKAGLQTFYEVPEDSAMSSLSRPDNGVQTVAHQVDTVRLDEVLVDLDRLDLIKVDAEGHDAEAIYGAHGLIKRFQPPIIFEAGPLKSRQSDPSEALYFYLSQEFGYRIFAVEDYAKSRSPISFEAFQTYREYPYQAVNFLAVI